MTQFRQHKRQQAESLSGHPPADIGPTISDRIRQATVAVCMMAAVAGSLVGSGALGGTPIAEAAGGALGAEVISAGGAIPGLESQGALIVDAARDAFSAGTRNSAFAASGFLMLGLLATLRLSPREPSGTSRDEREKIAGKAGANG